MMQVNVIGLAYWLFLAAVAAVAVSPMWFLAPVLILLGVLLVRRGPKGEKGDRGPKGDPR